MKTEDNPGDKGRRNFLKLAAMAAPAAAVTAGGVEAEASETAAETSGLRKTPHVQAYLDSARF